MAAGLAGCFAATFHLGWVLQEVRDEQWAEAAFLVLGIPPAVVALSCAGRVARSSSLAASALVFSLGALFVRLSLPNYAIPKNLVLDPPVLRVYLLTVATSVGVAAIGVSEGARLASERGREGLPWVVGGVAAGGLTSAPLTCLGASGFTTTLLSSAYLLGPGVAAYLFSGGSLAAPLTSPTTGGQVPGTRIATRESPPGPGLGLHVLHVGTAAGLILGVSGMALGAGQVHYGSAAAFLGFSAGALPSPFAAKLANAKKPLSILGGASLALVLLSLALESFVAGWHGSSLGMLVEGMVVGFVVASQVVLSGVVLPVGESSVGRRAAWAYLLSTLLVVGGALRGLVSFRSPGEFAEVGNFFAPLSALLVVLWFVVASSEALKGREVKERGVVS